LQKSPFDADEGAERSSETSTKFYQTTRYSIPTLNPKYATRGLCVYFQRSGIALLPKCAFKWHHKVSSISLFWQCHPQAERGEVLLLRTHVRLQAAKSAGTEPSPYSEQRLPSPLTFYRHFTNCQQSSDLHMVFQLSAIKITSSSSSSRHSCGSIQ
jgi:hypothetical protein